MVASFQTAQAYPRGERCSSLPRAHIDVLARYAGVQPLEPVPPPIGSSTHCNLQQVGRTGLSSSQRGNFRIVQSFPARSRKGHLFCRRPTQTLTIMRHTWLAELSLPGFVNQTEKKKKTGLSFASVPRGIMHIHKKNDRDTIKCQRGLLCFSGSCCFSGGTRSARKTLRLQVGESR